MVVSSHPWIFALLFVSEGYRVIDAPRLMSLKTLPVLKPDLADVSWVGLELESIVEMHRKDRHRRQPAQ
jgi:hypothetical protein